MRQLIWATILLGLARCSDIYGADWFQVNDLSLDVTKIERRYPYLPQYDEKWTYGTALSWDISTPGQLYYWQNRVWADGTQSQVRAFGWEFEQGFRMFDGNLEVFYYHHSEHAAEDNAHQRFPLDNRLGIRLKLVN